jgi:hypothetical protein
MHADEILTHHSEGCARQVAGHKMARMAIEQQSSASGTFLGEYSVCKAAGIPMDVG